MWLFVSTNGNKLQFLGVVGFKSLAKTAWCLRDGFQKHDFYSHLWIREGGSADMVNLIFWFYIIIIKCWTVDKSRDFVVVGLFLTKTEEKIKYL